MGSGFRVQGPGFGVVRFLLMGQLSDFTRVILLVVSDWNITPEGGVEIILDLSPKSMGNESEIVDKMHLGFMMTKQVDFNGKRDG